MSDHSPFRSSLRILSYFLIPLLALGLVVATTIAQKTEAPSSDAGPAAVAQVPLLFSKSFAPGTIGIGSSTTLSFNISNLEASPVGNMDFIDNLPAGVSIATPAVASSTCGGILTAPDGGTTISLAEGELGASRDCTISVNVTGVISGTHTNVSGDLTSDAGNSGPASADLVVDPARPGFSKSFSPGVIPPGGTSTLTFIIDNSNSQSALFSANFTDNLPAGMVVASPANASTDCGPPSPLAPSLTADPGSGVVTFFANGFAPNFPVLGAGSICTVTVDVTTTTAGVFANVSGELSAGSFAAQLSSGFATALLEAPLTPLIKLFTDDPVAPGDTVSLQFTITNLDRNDAATNITFTDDLDAALSGLAAVGLPQVGVCGTGSQLTGSSLINLRDGVLAPEASCTFTVTLQVPGMASPGSYQNTTSPLSYDRGGSQVTEDPATDFLVVAPAPVLTKQFVNNPVAAGGTVTLTFAITNTSAVTDATSIAFTDPLPAILVPPVQSPASGFCGPGSSAFFSPGSSFQPPLISVSGAQLTAGASCSFDFVLTVEGSAAAGTYANTTNAITANVGGTPLEGRPASDDLLVAAAPILTKSFTDDPVLPGDPVTLEFTLVHNPNAPGDATAIAFSDDLDAALSGLTVTSVLSDDCGGVLSGTGNLTYTGGALSPGDSCTVSVALDVPASAAAGNHTNTTSAVTADVAGLAVTGNQATDILTIAGLAVSKSFTDDPVVPGAQVTLAFTLTNSSPVSATTSINFTDDLDAALSGLAASGTPLNDVCGVGSQLSGTTLLAFTGGTLDPGATCAFTVKLTVPASAAAGDYANVTSPIGATVGNASVLLDPISDDLAVVDILSITKTFTNDPVRPGDTVNLEFTISNASTLSSTTNLAFTDDLNAALAGLVVTGTLPTDPCGAGSTLSGTSLLTLAGGALAPAFSCTFAVTLQVPPGAAPGAYGNTTSQVTGDAGQGMTAGAPATDELDIVSSADKIADLAITKTDGPDPVLAGTNLTYTIMVTNNGPDDAANVIVTDTLPAGVTLVSTSGCLEDPAGQPTCTLGTIAAGNSAQYQITVAVGAGVTGVITNMAAVTSDTPLINTGDDDTSENTTVNAQADLSVTKIDSADPVIAGQDQLVYTVTVSNAGPSDAVNVVATDTLPAGVTFLSTSGCTTDPNGVPTCTLNTIAAGASKQYTVLVDVDPDASGILTNQVTVTSSTPEGAPGNESASETTAVNAVVDLSSSVKTVSDASGDGAARPNEILTYTITVTNNGPSSSTNVIITDAAPANTTFNVGSVSIVSNTGGGNPVVTTGNVLGDTSMRVDVDVIGPSGGSVTVRFTVTVNPVFAKGTVFSNTARVSADGVAAFDTPAADINGVIWFLHLPIVMKDPAPAPFLE